MGDESPTSSDPSTSSKSNKPKPIYLHGDLDLRIIEARSLPNMDLVTERFRRCFTVCDACSPHPRRHNNNNNNHHRPSTSTASRRLSLHRGGNIITSDPYVAVLVRQTTLARTRVIPNSQNPLWDERFSIPLAHPVHNLEFQIKDNDLFGAELIGSVLIPASRLLDGALVSDWFQILDPSGEPPKPDSALRLEMTFVPCHLNPVYRHGITTHTTNQQQSDTPDHTAGMGGAGVGIRRTYFPVRKGGGVTLYQDAHVKEDSLPTIKLGNGEDFRHESCWEDICYAVTEAHHMIYVVGWSVFHKVKLVREPTRALPKGGDLTLGELLKYKSGEGVRVLLLVWDDKTSHHNSFINTEGVMATHDEDTRRYFKHSSVTCVLSPRYASSKLSFMKQQVVGNVFTHHQKCVLVDTQAHGNFRKITAFLGGIDLCDGRYDTPEHRIIRDLSTIFKNDFHNPTFPSGVKAPRQPWHDLHCRVEGPAAYDVLINFEQRWKKATKEFSLRKKMTYWHDDALLKISRISWILSPALSDSRGGDGATDIPKEDPAVWVHDEKDPESWHVQIFRSIDSGSVKGFPKTVKSAHAQDLICSKDLVIDKSIHTAYVQAIRSAQHFVYIENQYFLGSSYAWASYRNAGADNLVPMELALKVASKIRARERFAVYIVIPMWPEGDPRSAPMQEILFWQSQTIRMMYNIIGTELSQMEITDLHPQDYLNFYCLGNREDPSEDPLSEAEKSYGSKVTDSMKHRRFMVYVHAKGMIVDDEYVIVGSANINQRSLAGSKDTEIAMGAYQPHYTWGDQTKKQPKGQVYGYRMSLWAEHLGGMVDKCFDEPESLECVRKVNALAEDNWKKYTAKKYIPMQGHLLRYPLKVDQSGKVESLPNQETFPDVGGKVIGAPSPALPDVITT